MTAALLKRLTIANVFIQIYIQPFHTSINCVDCDAPGIPGLSPKRFLKFIIVHLRLTHSSAPDTHASEIGAYQLHRVLCWCVFYTPACLFIIHSVNVLTRRFYVGNYQWWYDKNGLAHLRWSPDKLHDLPHETTPRGISEVMAVKCCMHPGAKSHRHCPSHPFADPSGPHAHQIRDIIMNYGRGIFWLASKLFRINLLKKDCFGPLIRIDLHLPSTKLQGWNA